MKTKFIAIFTSVLLLQGCFNNEDKIINKDNVKRTPAILDLVDLNNGVVDKTSKINFGDKSANSKWLFTDFRPAENLSVSESLDKNSKLESGEAPKPGTDITSSPIIAGGKIFTLGGQGEIIARDLNNPENVIWQAQAEKEFFQEKKKDKDFYETLKNSVYDKNQFNGGNIVYDEGKIFVTTKRGNIFAINAETGNIEWQKQLNVPIRTTASSANGVLVLTTFDDETLAFDSASGSQKWKHSGIKEKSKYSSSPTPLILGSKVILSYSSGEVFALDLKSGNQIWSTILGNGFTVMGYKTAINDIKFSPIVGDGKVFLVAGDGSLNALDLTTGQRLWTSASKISGAPWFANGYVFAVTQTAKILALNAKTGDIAISKEVVKEDDDKEDDFKLSGPVIANGKILANDNKGNLFIISADSGTVEKTISIAENIESAPVIADGKIYFIDQKSNLIILE